MLKQIALDLIKRDLGKRYKPGEVIFHQGYPADCLYIIQKGKVEIVVESDYGVNQLTTLEKGDVFGEISLFAHKSRFATARALKETWVISLDEKTFISRLHQDPSLAFRMIRQMAYRIYDQDHELMRGFFDEGMRNEDVGGFVSYIDLAALVEEEMNRARRLWQTLSLAIIDVDDFNKLSQKYGVLAGESLLQSLGETLRATLRRRDVIGRFGDDRFGILLYETDGLAAVKVLEKVRRAYATLWKSVEEGHMAATFSCGIATFPEYNDPAKLSKAAYKSLSSSKKAGKNQVVLANPSN